MDGCSLSADLSSTTAHRPRDGIQFLHLFFLRVSLLQLLLHRLNTGPMGVTHWPPLINQR